MSFRIAKQFHFSASHQLTHLAARQPDHPCARLHGHNYVVQVELQGDRDAETGFVRDYGDLADVQRVIDMLDHQHLNTVLGNSRATTAEGLAMYFFTRLMTPIPELVAVRVSETPKTWAEFRRVGPTP